MKFFIDTADIEQIKEILPTGLVDGVTTNPSLIAKQGKDMRGIIESICEIVKGPVSAEVTATDYENMKKEGLYLSSIAKNIAVKVPLTEDGLKTCRELSNKGIMVNVTLCFSSTQAILAAKAGATYVSPFIGRLDDSNIDGIELIREIKTIYTNYNFTTKILSASVRTKNHITQSAIAGADIATIPPNLFHDLANHHLTDKGLETFNADWEKSGQKIL